MLGTLLPILVCWLVSTSTTSAITKPERLFDHDLLQKNMKIRLLKRDWKPLGPSSSTDEVLEEYRWDVGQAFKALLKSKLEYETAPVKDSEKLFQSSNYNKNLETIFVLHPNLAHADVGFVRTTVIALAMRNLHKKYNIFALDMPYNNPQMSFTIFQVSLGKTTYFEPMTEAISDFLVIGVDGGHLKPEQIHLLGWSYSGQLVGYLARFIYKKYATKVASIVSLDPYSHILNEELIHVSGDDARVVHVYHSNSVLAGTRERVGTADFVLNDGRIQPECKWPLVLQSTIKEPLLCSHMKVVQRFWYVVLYPSKFVARRCDTWNRFVNCFCEDKPAVTMRFPINTESQAQGMYFLRTLDSKPYGLGKWGVVCSSETLLDKEYDLLTIDHTKQAQSLFWNYFPFNFNLF